MSRLGRTGRAALSTVVAFALTSCGTAASVQRSLVGAPTLGAPTNAGFLGGVAADEPRAALVGKQVLEEGGSAADAAAAMGFALAVTLPSRAGIGGGGACLVYSPARSSPNGGAPESILFTPRAPTQPGGDRPAAVPMLAGGLLLLHARYGVLRLGAILAPAEQLARLGIPAPTPLVQDLAVVGPALLADGAAARVFGPLGAPLGNGDLLVQVDLSNVLAGIRLHGATYLSSGEGATALARNSQAAGGPITAADLRNAMPNRAEPLTIAAGKTRVAFLPPPADGGLASAAAFTHLQTAPDDLDGAQSRALQAASTWRHGGETAEAILTDARVDASASAGASAAPLGPLPASTSFVALDRTGGAVTCAVTMGNLFGTGRVVSGTGILLAASPVALPRPLLAAALAWNPQEHAFRAAVGGSGQEGAALGVAVGMAATLNAKTAMPSTVPAPGRINAVSCAKGLPGDADQCSWATDPRNAGLATGDSSQ